MRFYVVTQENDKIETCEHFDCAADDDQHEALKRARATRSGRMISTCRNRQVKCRRVAQMAGKE